MGIVDFQLFFENRFQFLGRMVLNESGSGTAAFDFQAVACMLGCCILVCGADEGVDEGLNCIEELGNNQQNVVCHVITDWIFVYGWEKKV
jgi:hypothetical protein